METVKLSHKKHLNLVKDYVKTAAVAKLVYVTDTEPGIARLRKGKGFAYILQNTPVKNKREVERIRKLSIQWTYPGNWF